jgi:hypothetical protein
MTMPLPPDGYPTGQAPLRGTRPKEVEISFWLWIAVLVIGLVSGGIAYSQIRIHQIQTEAIDRATTTALVVGLVIGLLVVAAEFVLVFLMRAGRNWARIVLAVLGGLAVLFGLIGLAVTAGARSVTGVLHLLLLIGAIVTMFLPAANAWFRSHRPGF